MKFELDIIKFDLTDIITASDGYPECEDPNPEAGE